MKKNKYIILIVLLNLFISSNLALSKPAPENITLKRGEYIFKNNCFSCHRVNFKLKKLNKNSSLEEISTFLTSHNKNKKINNYEISFISLYLKKRLDKIK